MGGGAIVSSATLRLTDSNHDGRQNDSEAEEMTSRCMRKLVMPGYEARGADVSTVRY